MKIYLIVVSMMFILAGCFHGERISSISPGMTVQELYGVMGKQEGYRRSDDYEVYSYYNKLISGWSKDRADYHYIFKNDKLVEYGAGEIRQNQSNGVVFLVPLQVQHR